MTAATVEAGTSLADELALETDTARHLANYLETIPDVGYRRQLAAQAVAERKSELALACQLLAERYGMGPSVAKLEREDALLVELLVLAVA